MGNILEIISTPQEIVNDDSVIIVSIENSQGDFVKKDSVIAEIETSKMNIEIHSNEEGYLNILCEVGEEIKIGTPIFEIHDSNDFVNSNVENKISTEINSNVPENLSVEFSGSAKKLIEDNGLNPDIFKEYQFVNSKIVQSFIDPNEKVVDNYEKKIDKSLITKIPLEGNFKTEKSSKIKLNEIKYLSGINSSGMISRISIDINLDKYSIEKSQNFIKNTPLPLIIYEVSRILLSYPNLNSFFQNNSVFVYQNINLGIAFDNNSNGLKVLKIADTNKLNLLEIEESILELSQKYNENKLNQEDITGSTFTITDLYSSNISNFHPLVNVNNSGILGIGGDRNGFFKIELSFDHRITSGLEVSNFLNELKERLEIRKEEVVDIEFDKISCYKCLRPISDNLDNEVFFIEVIYESVGKTHICSICHTGW